ncbi:MAG: hypothetical protein DRJ38_08165 [Thermoprotei archaeon]|nr:MAG: hypothetical protein DRJ38_08165 [Thermoprotei archaeon]
MEKLEFVGKLFYIADWETHAVLLTNADKAKVVENAGFECKDANNYIFCTAIETDRLSLLGTLLEDVLGKLHGKRVRVTIEVLDDAT